MQRGVELAIHGSVSLESGIPATSPSARIVRAARSIEALFDRRSIDDGVVQVPIGNDGHLEARVTLPSAGPHVLEVGADDGAKRWIWLPEGERVHALGVIELAPAGTVEVLVHDESAMANLNVWSVCTPGELLRGPDESVVFARSAFARCVDDRVSLRGVPCGGIVLEAHSQSGRVVASGTVASVSGGTTRALLTPLGFETTASIVVEVIAPGLASLEDPPETVRLVPATGETILGRAIGARIEGERRFTYAFREPPDVEYELRIDDSSMKPFRRSGVRRGDRVHAKLEGPCALRITLVEAKCGVPITAGLPARIEISRGSGGVHVLDRELETDDSRLAVDGLLTGDHSIVVRHPCRRLATATVKGLASGERREVSIRVEPGRGLHGVIGISKELTSRTEGVSEVRTLTAASWRSWLRDGTLVDDPASTYPQYARFRIDEIPLDTRGVLITIGPWFERAYELRDDVGLLEEKPQRFELPFLFNCEGRIRVAEGIPLQGASVFIESLLRDGATQTGGWTGEPRFPAERTRVHITDPRSAVRVQEDATFAIDALPVGRYALWLALPNCDLSDRDLDAEGALNVTRLGEFDSKDPPSGVAAFDLGLHSFGAVRMSTLLDTHALFFDPTGRLCRRVALHAGRAPFVVALRPGRYRVVLLDADGARHTFSRDLTVDRDAIVDWTPVPQRLQGRLRFVDEASGKPIANARFALASRLDVDGLDAESVQVATDADGACEVELLVDRWSVLGEPTGALRAREAIGAFDWPSASAQPLVVRVRR